MNRFAVTAVAALLAGGGLAVAAPAVADDDFITVGTGGVTGVYFPTGGALCALVNRDRSSHGVRCTVEATGGSIENLARLREGDLHLAVVQSDWQYHAYNGTGEFEENGPFEALRAVFSLHAEPFTVVVREDSDIEHFNDLAGKRVNIGNPGSGQRATMEMLMDAHGWTVDDFDLTSEVTSREQAQALCEDQFDAFVFTVGHPSGSVQEATTSCATRIVPVDGDVVDGIIDENPYYSVAVIPGGMYAGTPDDVATFGVRATIATHEDVGADTIHAVVRSVFQNLDDFKRQHPAFGLLEPETMINDALSAPLHDGARRFFEEAGMR